MSTLDGDQPCVDCGTTENIIWFTDSVLWNIVIREDQQREGILCIRCFVTAVEAVGFRPTAWRLLPEWPWAGPHEWNPTSTDEPFSPAHSPSPSPESKPQR